MIYIAARIVSGRDTARRGRAAKRSRKGKQTIGVLCTRFCILLWCERSNSNILAFGQRDSLCQGTIMIVYIGDSRPTKSVVGCGIFFGPARSVTGCTFSISSIRETVLHIKHHRPFENASLVADQPAEHFWGSRNAKVVDFRILRRNQFVSI